MTPTPRPSSRDLRVDLLRGLSLLSIFVDHIPNNRLADYTIHNFGFSDAAELFVILAGFSATMAYDRVFDRSGLKTGLLKILARCLKIYGVQAVLLLATLLVVMIWERLYGAQSLIVGPLLRDGIKGTVRGLVLGALPEYLDILPLYILLLASFPLIRFGMKRNVWGTIAAAFAFYVVVNIAHLDLPNFVDPASATTWYFNPFTWQLVFVMGAAFAFWSKNKAPLLKEPSAALRALCWIYLIAAFVIVDAWKLWPAPINGFPGSSFPFAMFGNEPKSFVTPWRLAHVVAIIYLALTSDWLAAVARSRIVQPVVACGKNSLQVFAVGCVLALFGRLIFKSAEVTLTTQVLVNAVGLGTMLVVGWLLEFSKRPAEAAESSPVGPSAHLAKAR